MCSFLNQHQSKTCEPTWKNYEKNQSAFLLTKECTVCSPWPFSDALNFDRKRKIKSITWLMHHWLLQIFWHLTLFSMSVSPPWIIFLAKVPCHALRSSIYLIFMNGKWHLCVFRRGACDCRVTLTVRATGGKGTEIFSSDKENIGVIYSMHRALCVIYNSGPTKCNFYMWIEQFP